MTTRLPKIITGLLTAATIAASLTAFTSPAQAWYHHHGFGFGFGAAVLGAAVLANDGPYYNCRLVNTYDRRGNFLGTVKRCW
jgi:hypothetical protein